MFKQVQITGVVLFIWFKITYGVIKTITSHEQGIEFY